MKKRTHATIVHTTNTAIETTFTASSLINEIAHMIGSASTKSDWEIVAAEIARAKTNGTNRSTHPSGGGMSGSLGFAGSL